MKAIVIALLALLVLCSTVVVDGMYAEPPYKQCSFLKFNRSYEGEHCWCAVEGQTSDDADVIVFVKVIDKYCEE